MRYLSSYICSLLVLSLPELSQGVRLWSVLKIGLFLLLEAFRSCRNRVLVVLVCGSSRLGLVGV